MYTKDARATFSGAPIGAALAKELKDRYRIYKMDPVDTNVGPTALALISFLFDFTLFSEAKGVLLNKSRS